MIISSDKANANVFCIRTSGKVRVYSSYRGGKLVGLAMYSLSAVEWATTRRILPDWNRCSLLFEWLHRLLSYFKRLYIGITSVKPIKTRYRIIGSYQFTSSWSWFRQQPESPCEPARARPLRFITSIKYTATEVGRVILFILPRVISFSLFFIQTSEHQGYTSITMSSDTAFALAVSGAISCLALSGTIVSQGGRLKSFCKSFWLFSGVEVLPPPARPFCHLIFS